MDKQIIIDNTKISRQDFIDDFSIELTNRNIDERKEIGSKYFDIILRKEQECEELNTQIRALKMNRLNMFEHLGVVQENKKLKQALTEIKEIAYELTNEEYTDFIEGKQKQIIQKISEVEDERI